MRKLPRFHLLCVLLALVLPCARLLADADQREWTLTANGGKFGAALVDVNLEAGTVRLRLANGEVTTYDTKLFSAIDRAWLASWAEENLELDELAKHAPGKLTRHESNGEFKIEYFVYEPSEAGPAEERPVLLLFNPGGKAEQYMKRFIASAEDAKLMVVTLGYFRNVSPDDLQLAAKDALQTRAFGQAWTHIRQNVLFDESRVFLGGTSDGARKAMSFTWHYPRAWAGIWNNGGWIGGADLSAHDFPDHMRVIIVNGNQDINNKFIEQDTRTWEKHQAKVGVISFEGGHQMPPQTKITQSFHWLLGNEDTFEEE
jgi:poly(3-hydroxybutyrate) depolymerase